LPEDYQQPVAHLQEGCPNGTQRGNLSAILLKKVKFENKNQKAIYSYKTFRGSSPNKALTIHTTNNPSQSRETVPLGCGSRLSLSMTLQKAIRVL
jgi:hypothetical protein